MRRIIKWDDSYKKKYYMINIIKSFLKYFGNMQNKSQEYLENIYRTFYK